MTLAIHRPQEFLSLVDKDRGTVDRRIFNNQQIYELELERIFARAWNFMAHDSQIPNPGDFFLTFIGEDRVIVVRDKDMQPQVLINSCRHRGNAVCRAEEGHATSFMCTYHGWTYDLKGNLVGVPGFKEVYHEDLKREEWGLIKAGKVDSYKGFIFATMDADAIPLFDYMGPVGRMGLNMLALRGNIKIVPGIQKYIIGCNWKLAADNSWDWYHPGVSHASALMTMAPRPQPQPANGTAPAVTVQPPRTLGGNLGQRQLVAIGEYGHAISGPGMTEEQARLAGYPAAADTWRDAPETKATMGPIGMQVRGYPQIFPNCWVATNQNQICVRMPRGPLETEIWWFTLVDEDLPAEKREQQIFAANHTFGPAGRLEQDDGENWDQSTRGTMGTVSQRYPLNYAMNRGRGQIVADESGMVHIDTNINEHAQLWLYRAWSEWMAAESWSDLTANHSRPSEQSVL